MTAKRFTVPKNYRCIQDNLTKNHYMCEDKTEAINLAYLLNELHEEHQKCKEYNGILYANHTKKDRKLVKQISELKQENEQLEQDNNALIHLLENQSIIIQELHSKLLEYQVKEPIVLTKEDLELMGKAVSYYTHGRCGE